MDFSECAATDRARFWDKISIWRKGSLKDCFPYEFVTTNDRHFFFFNLGVSKDGIQKPPPSVVSLHTPSVCTSHPFTLFLWIYPLMMMLSCHLIAMMISHLSYFHPVSSLRQHRHMVKCLYPFNLPDNRCWGSTYSSNGPHMAGVLARYLRGTATPNAQCVSR